MYIFYVKLLESGIVRRSLHLSRYKPAAVELPLFTYLGEVFGRVLLIQAVHEGVQHVQEDVFQRVWVRWASMGISGCGSWFRV